MDPIPSSVSPASTGSTTQTQASTKTAQDQQSQFLQLLVAQIKGQNPLDPMQGSEFVTQLAQFSSLEQLTHMNSSLEQLAHISSTMDAVQQLLSAKAQSQTSPQIPTSPQSQTNQTGAAI